jgi:propanol-preferring alcohol dehydrogenase
VQYLRLLSSAVVIVVDTSAAKRELALGLGADHVLDGSSADLPDKVRALCGGEGAAAVIDFVGAGPTLRLGLACLARQGMLVLVGLAGGTVPAGFFTQASEAVITTSNWGSRNDLAEVIALARAGRLTATVERHPLDDINQVMDRLEAGQVQGRAVVTP